MFGGLERPKTCVISQSKKNSSETKVSIFGARSNEIGYVSSYPNSSDKTRLLAYQQQKNAIAEEKTRDRRNNIENELKQSMLIQHDQKSDYVRKVQLLFDEKMKNYDDNLPERRKQLAKLFGCEERQFVKEVAEQSQNAIFSDIEEMKLKHAKLKAKREAERLEIVKEKKLQQFIDRCEEFRPVIAKRLLHETKEAQLIQIAEKHSQIRNEREIEHMWYKTLIDQINKKKTNEEQTKRKTHQRNLETREFWEIQCKEKDLKTADKIRAVREESIKLEEIKEQLRKEEIAELDIKRKKRNELYRDYIKQIEDRERWLAQKNVEEYAHAIKMKQLQEEELEKERRSNKKMQLRMELEMYMDYIARLDEERRLEERRLDELVQEEIKQIQAQQDDARSKFEAARGELLKDVMIGREKQLEYKKQEAEESLKMKQAENQLYQLALEQNDRMQADYQRIQLLNKKKYKQDLKQQIEYSQLQRQKEKEKITHHLAECQAEEERYKKSLWGILNSQIKLSETHPFRKAIEIEKCPCPASLY